MPSSVIAWCSPSEQPGRYETYTLIQHSLHTAAIADLFYDRWRWRSRISGLPDSLLLVAAGLHDIGKAWRGYQEAAITRYCSRGREPSFLYHEVLSGIVIAAMEKEAGKRRHVLARSPLWEALILSVVLHHHGMTGRYSKSISKIIDELFLEERPTWQFKPVSIRDLLRDALPPAREILGKLGCLARELGRGYDLGLLVGMIELIDSLEERISGGERLGLDVIISTMENALGRAGKDPGKEDFSATVSVLAGFTAVADSAAASIERSRRDSIPRGTYAWRVLEEAFGNRASAQVRDRLGKAGRCL